MSENVIDEETEESDPLMKRSNKDPGRIHGRTQGVAIRTAHDEDDGDDPLARRRQGQFSVGQTSSERLCAVQTETRVETWETLTARAKLGRFTMARSRKVTLRARLAALREDLEEDEETLASKAKNARTRIWVLEQLNRDVQLWWDKGDRGRSLRAACLLVGALAEVQDPLEYSSLWVLVITALNRLHDLLKVFLDNQKQEEPDEASRWNWYYKISCIRGIVVRLYVQAATWDLLGGGDVEEGARLFGQAQGISNPVVYQYFCAYLASRGLVKDNQSFLRDTLQSTKYSFLAFASTVDATSASSNNSITSEMMVLPLSLTLCNLVENLDEMDFMKLIGYCRSPAALHALLAVVDPKAVGKYAMQILETIELLQAAVRPFTISVLTDRLLMCQPPLDESIAKAVMSSAWLILRTTDESLAEQSQQQQQIPVDVLNASVTCSAKFLELCALYYGPKEISALMRELEKRVREVGGSSRFNPTVTRACIAVCARVEKDPHGLTSLVSGETFGRMFESLASSYDASSFSQSSSPKTDLAKRLLDLYLQPDSKIEFSAAVDWAKALNDSLHILTFEDERRKCNEYIRRFVLQTLTKVAPLLPDESRFSLLVDMRGRFFQSDEVIRLLLGAASALARSTKKKEITSACLAFCHASIPTLQDPVDRGMYYAQSAVLAACLGKLPQCDGLFKASVQCVGDACAALNPSDSPSTSLASIKAETSKQPEARVLELVRTVASSLVVAPGHPHPFYLTRGFVNALQKHTKWTSGEAFIAALTLIEVLLRLRLPYRVSGADANDVLFGDDANAYSKDALALAVAVEAKITSGYPDQREQSAKLMNRVRKNIVQRAEQVNKGSS